jgi:uncharacterized membrane protein YhaH (DUF805 family)
LSFIIAQGGLIYWLMTHPGILGRLPKRSGDADRLQAISRGPAALVRVHPSSASLFLYWIPYLAVTVRRLHDTGRSGWWMFKPFLLGFWARSSSVSSPGPWRGVGHAFAERSC